jgi:peptide/nickel transport system permease protein
MFREPVADLQRNFGSMTKEFASLDSYLPALRFHLHNQYHRWLFGSSQSGKGILRGDFGVSYLSRQPVGSYILERLPWTVCMALLSVLLAYSVSIPLAARMVKKQGGALDRRVSAFLYLIYSLPGFWLATLLLVVFANPEVMDVFPASGVKPVTGYPPDATFFQKAMISLPYLVLPTLCYAVAFIAVLTRLLRVSLQHAYGQDYIRTARAKGLDEKTVRLKHALPNALLPAVTLFAEVFPLAIGGSVILESIFTIPGMGSGIYQSIQSQDYPVMVAIFTLTGFMTMLGYLLTDIAYAFLDPRIRYRPMKITRIGKSVRSSRARWAIRWLACCLFLTLAASFLANDLPLYARIHGHSYFPALNPFQPLPATVDSLAEPLLAGQVDWKKQEGFMIWPLVTYNPAGTDLQNTGCISPAGEQYIRKKDGSIDRMPLRFRHWLGTTQTGSDVLSGIIHGTRISLCIGIFSMLIAGLIGIFMGTVSGFSGDTGFRMRSGVLIMLLLGILPSYFYAFYLRCEILLQALQSSILHFLVQLLISFMLFFCYPPFVLRSGAGVE